MCEALPHRSFNAIEYIMRDKMNEPYGYIGKILKVNLTDGSTSTLDTLQLADQFIGGRGIAAYIYWSEVPKEAKAFDPENRMIFGCEPYDPESRDACFGACRPGFRITDFPDQIEDLKESRVRNDGAFIISANV